MITQDELKKLFNYCEKTGNLIRKVNAGKTKAGDIAGTKRPDGYLQVGIKYNLYYIHRIIWVMEHGSVDSELQIDHIDGNQTNNKIKNLRLVTNKENNKNKVKPARNTSGVVGVHWCKRDLKWMAGIRVNGKQKNLGRFTDMNDAIKVRQSAEIECGFHENHGRD